VPSVRRGKAAFAPLHGAREGAALVAEQLGLEKRHGERGTIDGHKRPARTIALFVDGARHELFARCRVSPDDEHRRAGLGDRLPSGLCRRRNAGARPTRSPASLDTVCNRPPSATPGPRRAAR